MELSVINYSTYPLSTELLQNYSLPILKKLLEIQTTTPLPNSHNPVQQQDKTRSAAKLEQKYPILAHLISCPRGRQREINV